IEKVVLIEPKSPGLHVFSKVRLIRLSLPSLAPILKEIGCEVKIYFEEIAPLNWQDVKSADLIGISSLTCTMDEALRIAKIAKLLKKPVVIGGPHVTFEPLTALNSYCDFVIRGEGEETFKELVISLRENKSLKNIKGLSYRDENNKIHHNPFRPLEPDLDKFPDPDFSSVINREKLKTIPISTSRGCPYNCDFCSVTTFFGHKYRMRSIDRVIREIKNLYPKPKRLFVVDDNFVVDRKRTIELLNVMIKEKIGIPWSAQVRVEVAEDEEILYLLRKAGCYWVHIGFESINPKSLEGVNKRQRVEDYKKAVEKFNKFGINVHGMFIFGFDEDEPSIFKKTAKYASKIKLSTVQFLILTPIPGSKLYERFKERARIFTKKWSFYDGHHVVFSPLKVSSYLLQRETIRAMKKFYSLTETVKMLFTNLPTKNNLKKLYFRFAGFFLIRKWLQVKKNRLFLNSLKEKESLGRI
ncbi:B12-binding domain-containing radical SAM protein, partial [Candidatus Aminicenantes bacterium AC-335-A11]|nr:B12-binding domain-containing radical SAM protein [Candidatus Aminicenantes bacterium AC-335-A11]